MVGLAFWSRRPPKTLEENRPALVAGPNPVSATPTVGDYALEMSINGVKVAKSIAEIAGVVPGAPAVFGLALLLMQTCQDLTEIEEKAAELKDHIERVILGIVQALEGKEASSVPDDLLRDVQKFGHDLETVKRDLEEIAEQNRLLVVLFKAANRAKVERCMNLLKGSLERWSVSRDISHSFMLRKVELKTDKLQETVGLIEKSVGTLLRPAHMASHATSRQMPPKPGIFYGRDVFVDGIVDILVNAKEGSRPPRICIHGPGGMGKTSTAIAVAEHPRVQNKFTDTNRFWVPCVSATSPDILLRILFLNMRISRDTGDYLADIITELKSSPSPRLMLLDNFETPWNPVEGTRGDVENILSSLAAVSQLSIVVTMRTNVPPSDRIDWIDMPLGAVDAETSKSIYCAIHPRAQGKPHLDELLAELGHMPYAITLVATLGKRSRSMPGALLSEWRSHGPGMLSSDESAEDSMSRSIGLSLNAKAVAQNAVAGTLLATLAMLPAGTTVERLECWMPELGRGRKSAAISALSDAALIVDREDGASDSEVSISVLPVVQSYMRHGDRIPSAVRDTVRQACYKFVLDHKSAPGDPAFRENIKTLFSEETNIQHILLEATADVKTVACQSNVQELLDVLLAFSWYQHWSRPRTEVVEHALKLARAAGLQRYVAECLFCLGNTFFRLDRYDEARMTYIDARERFEDLSDTVRAGECACELVNLYIYMDGKSDAREMLDSVASAENFADPYLRARAKMARGQFSWYAGDYVEALEQLDAAREAFDTPKVNRPMEAALCLMWISDTLSSVHKWEDALPVVDRSLELFEKHGPDNHLVEGLLSKALILLRMRGGTEKIEPTLGRTLRRAQELGRPLAIAQSLDLFGEFYARQRDAGLAAEYYQAAEAQYASLNDKRLASKDVERCRRNRALLSLREAGELESGWGEGLAFWSDTMILSQSLSRDNWRCNVLLV